MKKVVIPKVVWEARFDDKPRPRSRTVRIGDSDDKLFAMYYPADISHSNWSSIEDSIEDSMLTIKKEVYHFSEISCAEPELFRQSKCICIKLDEDKVVQIRRHLPYTCPHKKEEVKGDD